MAKQSGKVEVAVNSDQCIIPAPSIGRLSFHVVGTAPYVQHKFSQKHRNIIAEKQMAGSAGKNKKQREARDFDADYEGATYFDTEGKYGVPAAAIRAAMISACRIVNFKMTLAKLSVFVPGEAHDRDDGTPLITLDGKREQFVCPVRNATGVCDLRSRPRWNEWEIKNLVVEYNKAQFKEQDMANLVQTVGAFVGIGEGRPDSRESCGQGWGTFRIEGMKRLA